MVPVGRLIVLRTTPKHKLAEAIAYITWPGLTALVVGPPLGGFITTYASWHWIFFLNLPIGIAALILTLAVGGERAQRRKACVRLAHFSARGIRLRRRRLRDGEAGQRRGSLAGARPGARAERAQRSGRDRCRAPQSRYVPHRPGIDEAQDLLAFCLRSERLPHRGLGAAVSATAHVSDCLRVECLSVGALSAGAICRRPDHEGLCHPGSSPLRISPPFDRERNHYRRNHGSVRPAQPRHRDHSGDRHSLLSRSGPIDGVHLPDNAWPTRRFRPRG